MRIDDKPKSPRPLHFCLCVVFLYKNMQTRIEMQLRVITCGIISTNLQYIILFDADFCNFCGDFGNFVGEVSDFG